MGVGVDIQQIPETPYRWMVERGDELSKMFRASGQPILQCQAKATDNVESYITKCTPANTTFLSHLQRVTRKVARQKLLLFQKSPTITVITGMTVSNPHHEPRARGMPSSKISAAVYIGCRTNALQEPFFRSLLSPACADRMCREDGIFAVSATIRFGHFQLRYALEFTTTALLAYNQHFRVTSITSADRLTKLCQHARCTKKFGTLMWWTRSPVSRR